MKMNRSKISLIAALFLLLPFQFSHGDDTVYGWELMSEQERAEHRTKMQSMQTNEERERYRIEHHKMMEERARQQGVTLPDMPYPGGKGMMNDGKGMNGGPGDGQGGGRGR